jgi:hypothetical protein
MCVYVRIIGCFVCVYDDVCVGVTVRFRGVVIFYWIIVCSKVEIGDGF